ncbi:dihydrodipicolinate synthase family protein [Halegenticoccus soli]|uniref:dihydrodipicolinate synthase family protein n=1 Tax=Halegenticoccus soli TaxID=1985678 RepID=UPI000C6CE3CC|nr:dihydrodipicolinate synthase family protein [Halegenticoccus soli]
MRSPGAVVPMATPIDGRTGNVDVTALENYTDFLLDGGVHGLFPCGSIGEFSSLTAAQRERVIETVASRADGASVFAGCGDTSVETVREHVDAAADAGADAAVVVTPYYLRTTQDGLLDFYAAVADDSPLPILLYDIPGLTGHHLSVETVSELAEHEAVVGLKDTSGDLTYHRDLIEATPPSFTVLQGATELAVAALDAGADGIIAGPANVFPAALAELVSSHDRGDRDRAVELSNAVVGPVVSATSEIPTAAALKYLVSLACRDIGPPLPPLPTLSSRQRRRLDRCYERVARAVGAGDVA